MAQTFISQRVSVVIPAYRVRRHILDVIAAIGPAVERVYVVDDCCPEQSGKFVQARCRDSRVTVLFHERNQGVGGALVTGYKAALGDGMDIVVKIDGDGQMDPRLISRFIAPLIEEQADYVKGNRFFALEFLNEMPTMRLFGNAILSFLNKLVSGYWNVMDPTNGYTAIHRGALSMLPLDKIDRGYFFESDMLFRLNTVRAVVTEVPMKAKYEGEHSSLRIGRILRDFPAKYGARFFKRIFYNYFLRDFNVCSVQLVTGLSLVLLGGVFGVYHWYLSSTQGMPASTGTVMLAAVPVILGFQLLLSALSFDAMNIPKIPLQRLLGKLQQEDSVYGLSGNGG